MNWIAALDMSKVTEKLPPDFWMKTGMFVLIVVVIVLAVRFFQNTNKIFLSLGIAVAVGIVFFSWIYNRNEPAFLTPVIEPLAQFFPSKGYEKKDVSDLDNQKKGKNVKPPAKKH
jgi:glucan phosphoethanolaminetransferase (alkaline phosphatase superfamily)